MALLQKWRDMAYSETANKGDLQRLWGAHFQKEKEIYAILLKNPDEEVKGTVKELADKYAFDTELIHVLDVGLAEIKEKIDAADGVLLGTPTINRDALKPMWDVTTVIDAIVNKGKPAGVFGSFGWSGEGVPMLVERLKGLKLNVVGEGVRVNFVPNEDELAQVRDYAENFAMNIE